MERLTPVSFRDTPSLSMGMFARKVDANQSRIVAALRKAGCSVTSLAKVSDGCPDLLVGYRNQTWLLEVKRPGGSLNELQQAWLSAWRGGPVRVVYTPSEALKLLGAIQ